MVKFMRDGLKVWPYCSECGCRLNIRSTAMRGEMALSHFGMHPVKDARGCICPKRFHHEIVQAFRVKEFMNA